MTAPVLPSSLRGKLAVVTGANRGLGLELASALAAAGMRVVLACRDPQRAQAAIATIRALHPNADLQTQTLDMASLASIAAFAERWRQRGEAIDLLCHNAAAIMVPQGQTADGFETHIGTNFLGVYALTAQLLPALAPAARIVFTGSLAHRMTPGLDFDDPFYRHQPYREMDAYAKSKLAVLSYAFELDRRLRAQGASITAVAAHPGYTATNPDFGSFWMRLATRLFAQAPQDGVRPILHAATAAEVRGGDYFGPDGFKELRGQPRRVDSRPEARDPQLAARLWDWAEQCTGIPSMKH